MPAYVYDQRTAGTFDVDGCCCCCCLPDDDGSRNAMHLKWNRRLTPVVFRDSDVGTIELPLRVVTVHAILSKFPF